MPFSTKTFSRAVAIPALVAAGCGPADYPPTVATETSASEASSSGSGSGSGGGECYACGEPTTLTTLKEPALVEMSGIVASRDHAGVYYVHNDSGDTARFFAVDEQGADLGTFHVTNATAVDWEDIARGPCADPAKSCLYLGDTGDNKSVRTSYTVYRVEEPAALGAGDHDVVAEVFPFVYEDGPHNAEALLVHPTTGVVTLVTKSLGGSSSYVFPMPLSTTKSTLTRTGAVSIPEMLPLVTAADIRPDAGGILLRTYGFAYFYPMAPGATAADALAGTGCKVPVALEPQGEAIGWLASGKGYVTVSEGDAQPIHRVMCP